MTNYLVTLILHSQKLTSSQLKTLVDICVNIGSIGLASIVIPLYLQRASINLLLPSIALSFVFWYIGITLSKKYE
ncbi:MAG: hypothetical protein UR39_C0003G0146 [Candidatus Woesebacteria bacterium GW2011_GWA1_33_30]|uniref:Uncharacterized protein n=1 Tax=Candidatus Woesebacteria bacterium GW2011_GWA2_33_28 TaxID=1618561 RepID=A0A0F9ZU16_9BACT|nr:MAG: hypothetical protein UR38_C0003G0149 [Candidatus Woesebacteria bacterium GW2011_GWA2_33_28]KKP48611.1 MAG: hypothetical protein UR39_C0003G0146 [Candidatus Woesebacteria bacterium GW2011_GWA1_33_30]KKP49750.1 MAG: hypothetical protein UR40_C0004G0149 [Microgenomates group bacterium GW2011_GWC1_33_32]KKP52367.1 MAG: hypothetical protein UR44_C0003G0149 [Candidatus Woesebacteria bacterium GW2011_GWB1_33_38]